MRIEHVSLIHIHDKKILLVLPKGSEYWQAPGGRPENGETDRETLVRECKEELDIDINPDTIKQIDTIHGNAHSRENVEIEIRLYEAQFDGSIKPSNEIENVGYFGYDELPNLPGIGIEFLNKLHSRNLL